VFKKLFDTAKYGALSGGISLSIFSVIFFITGAKINNVFETAKYFLEEN
jgi:hypothetical protein